MFGIVKIGALQYRVEPGTLIDVQKLEAEEGKDLTLDQVLLVSGKETSVGTPMIEGAKVTARVIRQGRSRKEIVFKRKPGLWQKKRGHRQHYTALLITEISNGSEKASLAKDHKLAQKYLK